MKKNTEEVVQCALCLRTAECIVVINVNSYRLFSFRLCCACFALHGVAVAGGASVHLTLYGLRITTM